MRLLCFLNEFKQPRLGVRSGDSLVDISDAVPATSVEQLLQLGEAGLAAARKAAAQSSARLDPATLAYLPPLRNPAKAFAIGLNYLDHAAESKFEPPKHPVIFQRFPTSWVAHGEPLIKPRVSEQFDYEAEIVAVIGKPGRYIPVDQALDHVAGYSLFNDGSVRDYQFRSNQWLWGKNFDRSGSFGPEFVTADELPRGAKGLQLTCRLNGELVQSANTRDMIFDVATLVAACSEGMLLQPGDMIITGTPSGVGLARKPPLWMKHGDVCEVFAEGIGTLRNPVIDEQAVPATPAIP